jgi:hypothetical protein
VDAEAGDGPPVFSKSRRRRGINQVTMAYPQSSSRPAPDRRVRFTKALTVIGCDQHWRGWTAGRA